MPGTRASRRWSSRALAAVPFVAVAVLWLIAPRVLEYPRYLLPPVGDVWARFLQMLADGSLALFDLAADPGEARDVAAERPEDFRRLQRALFEWLRRVEGGEASKASLDAARRAEERLRALGYLD